MTNVDPELTQHRFTLHGPVRILDLAERRLSLGERNLWLAPDVPTSDLELGTEVVAKGLQGRASDGSWTSSRSPASGPRGTGRISLRGLATSLLAVRGRIQRRSWKVREPRPVEGG